MPDAYGKNTLPELIKFFGCEGRPVTTKEFRDFWVSCTTEQQEYYKTAPLT